MDAWQTAGIKHFIPEEFSDPTELGSGSKMNLEFVRILDSIRDQCGFSFTINSGFRTADHNVSVGGKSDSAHLLGLAADIICNTSQERFAMVKYSIENKITRIGIGENFIHLDMDFDNPQQVIWLYPAK